MGGDGRSITNPGFDPTLCFAHVFLGQDSFQQVIIWVGRFRDAPHMHSTDRFLCVMQAHGGSFPVSEFGPSVG